MEPVSPGILETRSGKLPIAKGKVACYYSDNENDFGDIFKKSIDK